MSTFASFFDTGKGKLITRIAILPEWQLLVVTRVLAASRSLTTSIPDFHIAVVGEFLVAHTTTCRSIAVVLARPETLAAVPGEADCGDTGDENEERDDIEELHLGKAVSVTEFEYGYYHIGSVHTSSYIDNGFTWWFTQEGLSTYARDSKLILSCKSLKLFICYRTVRGCVHYGFRPN